MTTDVAADGSAPIQQSLTNRAREWVNSIPGVKPADQFIALDRRLFEDCVQRALASQRQKLRVSIQRALIATLGDTYDCTRVWSAWSVGTMDQDDFVPVLDRLDELVDEIELQIAPTLSSEPSS